MCKVQPRRVRRFCAVSASSLPASERVLRREAALATALPVAGWEAVPRVDRRLCAGLATCLPSTTAAGSRRRPAPGPRFFSGLCQAGRGACGLSRSAKILPAIPPLWLG